MSERWRADDPLKQMEVYGPAIWRDVEHAGYPTDLIAAANNAEDARRIALVPEMEALLALIVADADGNDDWPYVPAAKTLLARARGEGDQPT